MLGEGYNFKRKHQTVLWSLDRGKRDLDDGDINHLFDDKVQTTLKFIY